MVSAGYKPSWIYGGPTISVSALSETLQDNNVDVTVLTTNANGKHDFAYTNGQLKIVEGVQVFYYRRLIGDPISFSPAHTWGLIKRVKQYDLVHIHGWWNWVAIMALFICKLYQVPHVLSPRGALSEYTFRTKHTMRKKNWLHKLLFKGMLNRTLLHVTSEEEARKFKNAVPKAKIITIPNIVSIPEKWNKTDAKRDTLQLIFLGRLDQVKNLELLIECLKEVAFSYTLTIAGEGDPDYAAQLQNLIGDYHQIRFIGPVYDSAKFEILAKADLLVLLSHTENFGNVVIESLSQGTAVLLSKHVGASDFVLDHDLGWVIEPDKRVCINTLERINKERERLIDIRLRAPQIIQAEYNPFIMASRYINECYSLVNKKFITHNETSPIE